MTNVNTDLRAEMDRLNKESNIKRVLSGLHTGDKVKLTTGEVMEFVKLNRTKFIGRLNDKEYNVPIQMFVEVLEKVDLNKIRDEKSKNNANVLSQLKKGDWFYINKNNSAITFRFEKVEVNKIIGINPINGSTARIDITFEICKINL